LLDSRIRRCYDDSVINVVIVARQPIIREGLRGLLASEQDLHLKAPTRTASGELVEDILAERADVVLIDVDVLELNGWALLGDLRGVAPDLPTLVVGDTEEDSRVASAIALGAHGYITRDATPEQMASAIRAARHGFYVLHRIPAGALLTDDEREFEIARGGPQDLIEPLSVRELDVLRLMVRGMSNKQIAVELIITEHTVKFHIRAILAKLGAANRTEAVTSALQKGLVSL
jgi:DNA-binding NarL/FixJ family response regulator